MQTKKKALQQITFITLKSISFSSIICGRIVMCAAALWETRTIDIAKWLAAAVGGGGGTAAVILLQT